MDRGDAALRPRPARSHGPRSQAPRPRGDPDVLAPRAARRVLPCRHASRKSVRRRCRRAGGGRFRHHGPARAEGAALSRRDPARLHHPQLPAHRRGPFRGRLRAAAAFGRELRPGDPRIGEPIHSRTAEEISMARLFMLLFEITGLFDMRTRPELLLLQKTMVVVEGVARSLDPKLDMWA